MPPPNPRGKRRRLGARSSTKTPVCLSGRHLPKLAYLNSEATVRGSQGSRGPSHRNPGRKRPILEDCKGQSVNAHITVLVLLPSRLRWVLSGNRSVILVIVAAENLLHLEGLGPLPEAEIKQFCDLETIGIAAHQDEL